MSTKNWWDKGLIRGLCVFDMEVINRLRSLHVPEGMIWAVPKNMAPEKNIISWAQNEWGVSEEEALAVLNGKGEPPLVTPSPKGLGTFAGTCVSTK